MLVFQLQPDGFFLISILFLHNYQSFFGDICSLCPLKKPLEIENLQVSESDVFLESAWNLHQLLHYPNLNNFPSIVSVSKFNFVRYCLLLFCRKLTNYVLL